MDDCVQAYQKHMNLKLAALDLGMPWQTLYVRLKKAGVKVLGDKLRYGSDRDKLAAVAEARFLELVPFALNMNGTKYQSKYDFEAGLFKVDVKASKPHQSSAKFPSKRWSFSIKKQTLFCDFIVCFCLTSDKEVKHCLLVPSEFFSGLQTVSVSCSGSSKWLDYAVQPEGLADFFKEMSN
jgi:hypothetical protein